MVFEHLVSHPGGSSMLLSYWILSVRSIDMQTRLAAGAA
jgi:hypothetical protein